MSKDPSQPGQLSGGSMKLKSIPAIESGFEQVSYATISVATSIVLLASTEPLVALRALSVLSKYADKQHNSNLKHLYNQGILSKLLYLTRSNLIHDNLSIARFTMKLLAQLSGLPLVAHELDHLEHYYELGVINKLFMEHKDEIVRELVAHILSNVIKSQPTMEYVMESGIVDAIFVTLRTAQDPDLQRNTLQFLSNLLQADNIQAEFPIYAEFTPGTLLCYLSSEYSVIQEFAINILEKIASWRSEYIQEKLKLQGVIQGMILVILNEEYKDLHMKAFLIIDNCLQSVQTALFFVGTEEFMHFCNWSSSCKKAYMPQVATILATLTRIPELRQPLYDFSIEDCLLSQFRTNNELVLLNACESIGHMTSHPYCCEKMLTPVILRQLIVILMRTDLPMIPYREMAIRTIYNFLKRNPKTLMMLLQCGGVVTIENYFLLNRPFMTPDCYYLVLDIIHMYASNPKTRHILFHRDIYHLLLRLMEFDPLKLAVKAVEILHNFIPNTEFRHHFVDLTGPNLTVKKLMQTPHDEVVNVLLSFIKKIFTYKKVGMVYLMIGSLSVLVTISAEVKREVPAIEQLTNMMYNLYLPLKFFELGRLDTTDLIKGRFYIIKDKWDQNFPFLELLVDQQMSTISSIYIIDFDDYINTSLRESVALDNKSLNLPAPKPVPVQSDETSQEDTPFFLEGDSADPFMRHPIPDINYGAITKDPYLSEYVESLETKMYSNKFVILCFQHKVRTLAKFVDLQLSGLKTGGGFNSKLHEFNYHLFSLKVRLGTNMIPFGFLRSGFKCERALLFKALADQVGIPATLVKGKVNTNVYWNEVPLVTPEDLELYEDPTQQHMALSVVDLMDDVGRLMLVGSEAANRYCETNNTERQIPEVLQASLPLGVARVGW